MLKPGRRRASRSAGGPLFQPEQLREIFRPTCRGAGQNQNERRDLGQPVRQSRQPAGTLRDHRTGNLRADARQGDGFVRAVGTGGTLAGVSMALKERNPGIKIAPRRSDRARRSIPTIRHGELKMDGSSITEGIGQGRSPPTWKARRSILPMNPRRGVAADRLRPREHEGLLLGGSSGINIAGAIRLAGELGPGHTIVTLLCDSGARYASKLFNPGVSSLEGPSGSRLAGAKGRRPSVRLMTEALFRDDAYRRSRSDGDVLGARGMALWRDDLLPARRRAGGRRGANSCFEGGSPLAVSTRSTTPTGATILHVPADGARPARRRANG